jgi:hypothetical protein
MSTLFNVEVDDVSGKTAKLRLTSVHPDAGPFGKDDVFALRVLYDTAYEFTEPFESKGLCPLGDAITYKQVGDEDYAGEHASDFIDSVEVEPDDLPDQVPVDTEAHYTIKATDAKWLEHLEPGKTWRSAAYS